MEKHKRCSDHNDIKFQVDVRFRKPSNFPKEGNFVNFDNPQDWNSFKTLTSNDSNFQEFWHDSSSVERRYKHWSNRINSILHKFMLSVKRHIRTKQTYTIEIRRYISERKEVWEKLPRTSGISETGQSYLSHKIKRPDKIIDFNHQFVRGKVCKNGHYQQTRFLEN